MASQVEDLARLLGGRRALLVGHSYGGNVALTLGAQQPQLVAAIVVYESPMSWEPWWPGTTGGGAALAAGRDGGRAAEVFMRGLVGDAAWDRLPERTRDKRRAEGEAMLGELSDLRRNRPWIASEITCPVMIGRGTNGRPHHQDGARQLHEQISGSQLVTLDGCRHDAPLSHPQLFTEQLIEPMVSYLEA